MFVLLKELNQYYFLINFNKFCLEQNILQVKMNYTLWKKINFQISFNICSTFYGK